MFWSESMSLTTARAYVNFAIVSGLPPTRMFVVKNRETNIARSEGRARRLQIGKKEKRLR